MGSITAPTAQMMALAKGWEKIYPSAVFAGINGDAAHQTSPGKHLSRSQNRDKFGAGCWPIEHPKDKRGPNDKACAIDMRMSKADMVKSHARIRKLFNNRDTDPRAKYFAALNTWDGTGDAVRIDFINGSVYYASPDHKWHDHGETFYEYVNSAAMVRAWLSALRSETIAQYEGEDDMPLTDEDVKKLADELYAGRKWKEYYDQNANQVQDFRTLPDILFSTHATAYRLAASQKLGFEAVLSAIAGVDTEAILTRIDSAAAGLAEERVDEEKLAAALAPLILAGLPAGTLTSEGVEAAVRNVLLQGVEPPQGPAIP